MKFVGQGRGAIKDLEVEENDTEEEEDFEVKTTR